MGERKRLSAYAVALAGLVLAVVFHWWTLEVAGASAEIGLREARVCLGGLCMTGPLPEDGQFSSVAQITYYVILLDALAIAALMVLCVVSPSLVDRLAKPAGALSGALGLLIGLCFLTIDAPIGQALTGIRVGLLGALSAVVAGGAAALVDSEHPDGPPIETSVLAAARAATPAPREPVAPAPKAAGDFQRQIDAATRSGPGRGVASKTAGSAPVDVGRTALRFVVDRGRIDPGGLTVKTIDGAERTVAWSDFAVVVVRRLPPDPPFSKLLLIDLATTSGPPIRLLPSSRIDWRQLPGGAAATARDNARSLIALIRSENSSVSVEPASQGFVDTGAEPSIFGSMRQFAEYDARYG
jgi:hypothetical protein